MSNYQLEDALVEGTGTYQGHFPARVHEAGTVVPRIFPITIRQRPYETSSDNPFLDAFEFIGTPVDVSTLKRIRQEKGLSENYGAVLLPKSLLDRVNPEFTRLIVGEADDNYIVAGLLPTDILRWDARRNSSDAEGIVYALQKEFPTLDPEDLIRKWGEKPIEV